ncbi:MAG: hypothetical protein ACJ736_12720 [Streptomyces sp.]
MRGRAGGAGVLTITGIGLAAWVNVDLDRGPAEIAYWVLPLG